MRCLPRAWIWGTPLGWGNACFGIQIYCDFSAHSDIAIGSALLLGIRLPENFKTRMRRVPHRISGAGTSSSTWLRDYLYISLGGSRKGQQVVHRADDHHGPWWPVARCLVEFRALGRGARFDLDWTSPVGGSINCPGGLRTQTVAGPKAIAGWFITQVLIFLTWLIFRVEDTKMLMEAIAGFLFLNGEFDVAAAREVLPEVQHLTTALVVVFILMHGILAGLGGCVTVFLKARPSCGACSQASASLR